MVQRVLRKIANWIEQIHTKLVLWEMRRMLKRMGPPQPNLRKLEVDEIDMGNMGRWQATDDQRLPPAHTSVNVGTYIKK